LTDVTTKKLININENTNGFFCVYYGNIYQLNFLLLNSLIYSIPEMRKRITVNITINDEITDETRPSLYSKKLKKLIQISLLILI